MRITIIEPGPGEEDEVIVKCREIDEDFMELLNLLRQGGRKINGYKDGNIYPIDVKDIYYFEAVDQKVFAYSKRDVFEIKSRLYELEASLPANKFLRTAKSMIVNLSQVKHLSPAFSGRFEAELKNGEKVIISRQYVSELKRKLGL
ncbi:MAG: LytTR family transcriptional regulator DNA-binding domain-containing protein [Lachnospiraceae bacterium]|nr:LytTR family transcriptional regulator DNA-binding domain-containing protein [Lachnospiraceae bacterium]MDE6980291.1 LytTR family transcriptional regulator DNA-binding domain-containing protein [Lachnospiraceae bacterium]